MAIFLKLKLAGSTLPTLVNVDHIQQVRPLTKGVRIYWGTPIQSEEGGAYADTDAYDITLDDLVEKLRAVQVEVLP